MKTLETDAICLKATPFEEAHQIVSFYTAEYGAMRAIAKGIKKSGSKLAGACEPLTLNHVALVEGRSLHTLRHYDRVQSFSSLRTELERMAVGSVATDMIHLLGREHDPDSEAVYHLLAKTLADLNTLERPWIQTSLVFHAEMLQMAGYAFAWGQCARCEADLPLYEERYFSFSTVVGGFLCRTCEHQSDPHGRVNVSSETIALFLNPENSANYGQALKAHRFLEYYWGQRLERKIQSFGFLFQLLAAPAVGTSTGMSVEL